MHSTTAVPCCALVFTTSEGQVARKVKEFERTCKKDGTVWYVPPSLRKVPSKPGIFDKMRAGGGALSGNAGETTRLGNMQRAYSDALQAARCPQCGSLDFSERRA